MTQLDSPLQRSDRRSEMDSRSRNTSRRSSVSQHTGGSDYTCPSLKIDHFKNNSLSMINSLMAFFPLMLQSED